MSKELGRYDPDMEMFIESVREPDPNHLIFMKKLVSEGKFEDDLQADIIVFKPKTPQENVATTEDC